MANLNLGYNNHVRFVLKADNNIASFKLDSEPVGWSGDDIGLNRHSDYHGIFFNFTSDLEFYKEAKDYIETAYRVGGINTILRLRKDVKYDHDGDVKWKVKYIAIADWTTMESEDNKVKVKFNSLNLETIIKSHESDEFELERADDINGDDISEIPLNVTGLSGRDILQIGESAVRDQIYLADPAPKPPKLTYLNLGDGAWTIPSKKITFANKRDSTVDSVYMDVIGTIDNIATNMFFVSEVTAGSTSVESLDLTITLDLDFNIQLDDQPAWLFLDRWRWETGASEWTYIDRIVVESFDISAGFISYKINETYYFEDLPYSDGFTLSFDSNSSSMKVQPNKWTIITSSKTYYDETPAVDFIFNHDLIERLLYIMTGRTDAFYSKYFGRTERGYEEDGDGGLVGIISGFLVRGFKKGSEKYKSIKISLKDVFSSNNATFNVGVGIETINLKERVRVEDMRYFYQNQVAIKLPEPVSSLSRIVDGSLFFSGMTFGYDKSGAYEGQMGLDEPNTQTEWVSPIRRSDKKYKKNSKIRSDEVAMEIARRKPQDTFPLEDTKYDDVNWYLDLKRTIGDSYAQKGWADRLQKIPTGIFSPETYHSMWFTPLQMLKRHAWIFKSGMELYFDKYIKYISSQANATLSTLFIGDEDEYTENSDIEVDKLDRARFLPEIVKFKHPVDDELMDWITGTTRIEYQGSFEDVPNYYFQFEFTNENGEAERGYLMNLEPGDLPEFTMQKVNNMIIQ